MGGDRGTARVVRGEVPFIRSSIHSTGSARRLDARALVRHGRVTSVLLHVYLLIVAGASPAAVPGNPLTAARVDREPWARAPPFAICDLPFAAL